MELDVNRYGVEARVDLMQSHAPLLVGALIRSLNEGFEYMRFDQLPDTGSLCDVYANERFCVAYYFHEAGRDELCVSWLDPHMEQLYHQSELLVLARQLAHLLGGGANPRFQDHQYAGIRAAGDSGGQIALVDGEQEAGPDDYRDLARYALPE